MKQAYPSEHVIQVGCVIWFRIAYPNLARLLFAIPNGGQRSAATAGKLKAEGVVPGVADLFLSVPRNGQHGLYIEMKSESGRQTAAQKEFEAAAVSEGYGYVVCNSYESFKSAVADYLKPKKN